MSEQTNETQIGDARASTPPRSACSDCGGDYVIPPRRGCRHPEWHRVVTPGLWRVEVEEHQDHGGADRYWHVIADADREYVGGIEREADAEHIATFDPPTVLALIERLERAEAAVERVRALADKFDTEPYVTHPFHGFVIAHDVRAELDGPR